MLPTEVLVQQHYLKNGYFCQCKTMEDSNAKTYPNRIRMVYKFFDLSPYCLLILFPVPLQENTLCKHPSPTHCWHILNRLLSKCFAILKTTERTNETKHVTVFYNINSFIVFLKWLNYIQTNIQMYILVQLFHKTNQNFGSCLGITSGKF